MIEEVLICIFKLEIKYKDVNRIGKKWIVIIDPWFDKNTMIDQSEVNILKSLSPITDLWSAALVCK